MFFSFSFSFLLSLITYSLGNQLPCHEDSGSLWRDPCGEELRLANLVSKLGSGSEALVKPYDDCSSGQQLDRNLLQDPKLEPPM